MADTKTDEVMDGTETSQEEKTPDESLTTPATPENNDVSTVGISGEQPEQEQAEKPQSEQTPSDTPEQSGDDSVLDSISKPDATLDTPTPDIADTPPTPDVPDVADGDGEAVIPSNVISGSFGDKQASAENEADRENVEQGKPDNDAPAQRRGSRPPKADKPDKEPQADKSDKPDKADKEKADKPKSNGRQPKAQKEGKKAASVGGIGGTVITPDSKSEELAKLGITKINTPAPPEPPRDAKRPGAKETIVYIDHAELHPFKNHPFQIRDDDAMKTLVESVKERGVDQPAIVRPRENGGYEIVAGHRRRQASELAGLKNVPCVVRNMTDDETILAMTESNFNQRSEILPSERAQALKMQLDAIKRQGARFNGIASGDVGKRSNEIVADRNKMAVKQVQRYIALNNLTPDLMKFVDDKKVPFTAAVEMSYIKPKNQNYIAVAIDSQQSSPSLAQAQRMRELDAKNVLNGDVIDGIMLEEKKEETRVILNSQELGKYFTPDKTPREMKDTILKLLDEYKEKQPPELGKPEKKLEQEK